MPADFNFLTQMRRIGFLFSFVAFMMISCAKETVTVTGESAGPMGEVTIALASVDGHHNALPVKSTVEVPDAGDFKIEIFNAEGVRLYRDTYANSENKKIPLNAGEYRLLASHGKALGVGFDAIYFAADRNFTVRPQTAETIEATARMANVKVAVNFGENLDTYYAGHYARVKNPQVQDYLQFDQDETRAGYIPAGDLTLEVYANVDGTWKYYKAPAKTYSPNDFVTFNVDIDPRQGDLTVGIKIDDTEDLVEEEIKVPSAYAPGDAPVIVFSGFDGSNNFVFRENEDISGIQADFVVMGGIAGCTLNIKSDYLAALGIPESVDLLNAEPSVVQTLNSMGIRWFDDIAGGRIACVDFSGMSKNIQFDPDNIFYGTFSLSVTDEAGKNTVSDDFNIAISPVMSLNANTGNAFAHRISGVSASVTNGYAEKLSLEYSRDGNDWLTAPAGAVSGESISFGAITQLEPNTEYQLRLKYDGKDYMVTEPLTLMTEKTLQVENASMDEWGYMDTNLHYPGPEYNSYWATRNTQTTSSGLSTWYCRNSGTYSSSDAVSGSAALLTTIGWGSGNTWAWFMSTAIINNISPAFLVLGSSDTSGNITAKGVPFESRPDAVTFFCKYTPKNGSIWEARVEVLSGDSVIGSASMSSGDAVNSYTKQTLDIVYSDNTKKATALYLYFTNDNRNRSYSKDDLEKASDPDRYQGSILLLDDIALVY